MLHNIPINFRGGMVKGPEITVNGHTLEDVCRAVIMLAVSTYQVSLVWRSVLPYGELHLSN